MDPQKTLLQMARALNPDSFKQLQERMADWLRRGGTEPVPATPYQARLLEHLKGRVEHERQAAAENSG